MKAFGLLGVTCLVALMHQVAGYGNGAPPLACKDLVPQHKVPPRNSSSPYIIIVDKKNVKAGDPVKITITGKNQLKFKGFMVQARVNQDIVGHFQETNGVKVLDCDPGKQNAATHPNPEEKEKIEVIWVAPSNISERVKFWYTVAKDGGVFWVAQTSDPISVE